MIGRGGRIRTGTGNDAQRVLSPPCLRSNHAAIKWCGQRESHPHELALTGFSLRRVYCFATSAKTGASTGTCALLSALPRQSIAFYGLDAKMVEAEGLAPSQPARATRLQRAAIAALPRFEKWGLERDSHPRPSPYEGAALPAAPSSQVVGRLGNAPSSAG